MAQQNQSRNYNNSRGYELVPILRGRKTVNPVNHTDIYKKDVYTGTIKIKAKVVQPLSVTSGFWKNVQAKGSRYHEMLIYRDGQGRVVIPGSSIKGMLRHYVRVLSERTTNNYKDDDSGMPEAIFGSTSFRSRVRTSDMIYNQTLKELKIFQQYSGHPHGDNYKIYSCKKKEDRGQRPEFFVEIVPAGSTLDFAVNVEGLRKNELGVLFLAMGVHPEHRFCVKFGRGKNIGMGGMTLEIVRFERDQGILGKEVYEGEKLRTLINESVKEYFNFVGNRQALMTNLQILKKECGVDSRG